MTANGAPGRWPVASTKGRWLPTPGLTRLHRRSGSHRNLATELASGLVERLPIAGGTAKPDHAAAVASSIIRFRPSSSSLIYLAMGLAIFVSLLASGHLS